MTSDGREASSGLADWASPFACAYVIVEPMLSVLCRVGGDRVADADEYDGAREGVREPTREPGASDGARLLVRLAAREPGNEPPGVGGESVSPFPLRSSSLPSMIGKRGGPCA
jgi:hypothetical protein